MSERAIREDAPSGPQRVLVLFAHPAVHHSRVQRTLLQAARSVADVTVHDLYHAYPDFDIDVPREQALLLAHDVVVWQHPFYWYSTPPLVKQWEDLVLEHGWAYGRNGKALHGKSWLHAVSTGGGEQAYQHDGKNRFTMRELLAPLEQTARLCGMRWIAPFVVHSTHVLSDEALVAAAGDYARVLTALRDGTLRDEAPGDGTLRDGTLRDGAPGDSTQRDGTLREQSDDGLQGPNAEATLDRRTSR